MKKAGECRPFSWDPAGHGPADAVPDYSERFNPVCRPTVGTYPLHHQPLAYSERLMVKLPNTGASRWPLNSRVLW